VVGECAVEFGEQSDHVEGHRGGSRVRAEDLSEEAPGHAVAGVEDDPQSRHLVDAGEFADAGHVLFSHGAAAAFVEVDVSRPVMDRSRHGESLIRDRPEARLTPAARGPQILMPL
jgi:hypothetical protein